jgi:hypothetical protein
MRDAVIATAPAKQGIVLCARAAAERALDPKYVGGKRDYGHPDTR